LLQDAFARLELSKPLGDVPDLPTLQIKVGVERLLDVSRTGPIRSCRQLIQVLDLAGADSDRNWPRFVLVHASIMLL
jgi:hypothetical protein